MGSEVTPGGWGEGCYGVHDQCCGVGEEQVEVEGQGKGWKVVWGGCAEWVWLREGEARWGSFLLRQCFQLFHSSEFFDGVGRILFTFEVVNEFPTIAVTEAR